MGKERDLGGGGSDCACLGGRGCMVEEARFFFGNRCGGSFEGGECLDKAAEALGVSVVENAVQRLKGGWN